jgi:DNA-binding MurR/RpiR family transcriptional regulator
VTIKDLLVGGSARFTGAEIKVVRTLIANYPSAGLGTAGRLAREAGVSDPTVVRFVAKLGFPGYAAFQESLLSELEAHMASPLTMFARRSVDASDDPCRAAMRAAAAAVEANLAAVLTADVSATVELITDPKARIFCLGGRFSRHLAALLHAHLVQLRTGAFLLGGGSADLADALADLASSDVLAVFDYRRWQSDIVSFAEQAAQLGVRIILFTDPWRSPIADVAKIVLASPVDTASPFDTMTPALALVEGLIAAITAQASEAALARITAFEQFRTTNRVTLDAPQVDEQRANMPAVTKHAKRNRRRP